MFKVSARTVLELGSELISSDAIAFYELIKNGVDAGTKDGVTIKFKVVLARRDYLELRHTGNRLRNMPDNGNHAEDEFDFEEALAELLDETRARLFSDAGKLYDRAIEFLEDIDDLDEYDAALEEIDALNQVTVSDTGSGMSLEQLETVFLVLGTKSRKEEVDTAFEDGVSEAPYLGEKGIPEEVRSRLESLRASMKAISKRLRILDPLSVSGRQRKEAFELDELVRDLLSAHEAQFDRHHVKLETHFPDRPVALKAVKGMVAQVIENLVSNSVYWMDIERERKLGFKPLLTIAVEDNPPRVRVTDNGPGISPEYAERVFDLFFSLKDKSRRRGLGLFIAREAAEHNGGALVIDTEIVNREGRYTTFDYRVIGSDE